MFVLELCVVAKFIIIILVLQLITLDVWIYYLVRFKDLSSLVVLTYWVGINWRYNVRIDLKYLVLYHLKGHLLIWYRVKRWQFNLGQIHLS